MFNSLNFTARVFELSKMNGQFNKIVPFSSVLNEFFFVMRYPSFSSVKFQTFCSSRVPHLTKVSLTESTQSAGSLISNRGSQLASIEAQDVLFDYLHSTRSLSYTDAEHISKNSQYFIQSLLSKIDARKDVTRSLARFLRCNPINEFEPFFESLGLSPLKISSLLPQHFMYLSDDDVMLENYHVLWAYGIPRNKMGKMYMEARQIFGYANGMLTSKLQAYENLGLSRKKVIKLVSCCPLLLIGTVDNEFVKFLEKLKGIGFKNDWIGGYLSGKGTYNWNRTVDTMEFLEKVGYSKEQLCILFKTNPGLVFYGSGRKVYVLFGRLLKLGLKMNEVYQLFMQNLSGKCTKNLLQAVGFMVEIGMRLEEIANIVSNHAKLMGSCSLKAPKTVCSSLNVERDGLCQIIKDDPLKLFHLASKRKIKIHEQVELQNPSKHLEKTTFLLRLGYVENSEEMKQALKQFRGRGDQLQERFDCLVEAGLDSNNVRSIIKHAPMVLNQRKEVIKKKMDFLKNCLGYPVDSVLAFPSYLCYNLERINHRFTMCVWMRERGVVKPKLSLSTMLAWSDARFVKYFVDVHPEGPAIWQSIKKSSTVCSSLKVERDGLCQIIKDDPLKLFHLTSERKIKSHEQAEFQNPSKHLEKTTFLLRLGYVENSEEMTKALKQFRGRGDQLQERFDCLVEAGLDSNIVRSIIKRAPMVLGQSKELIEKKMDFLKNRLGHPIDSVLAFPSYLCYDLERIDHRFAMYVQMRERGAVKPKLSLSSILACSDARFLKYFVDVHPEGPAIWESIKKSSNPS